MWSHAGGGSHGARRMVSGGTVGNLPRGNFACHILRAQDPDSGNVFGLAIGHPADWVAQIIDLSVALFAARLRRTLATQQAGRNRFAGIIRATANAMISVDHNRRIVHSNESAEAIFGYLAREAIGLSLNELIPEEHLDAHRGHMQGFVDSGSREDSNG